MEDPQRFNSRRSVLKAGLAIGGGMLFGGALAGCSAEASGTGQGAAVGSQTVTTPQEAIDTLMAGNQRFVTGRSVAQAGYTEQRAKTLKTQEPFAVIVACSDSRVSPEILFDQGLGRLFVVRVAGNTADSAVLQGSIEYATVELGSVLVMVLGHQNCGAVKAALQQVTEGSTVPGQIADAVAAVVPAARQVTGLPASEQLDAAIEGNVRMTVSLLKSLPPLLSEQVATNKIEIVGGEYKLDTGKVALIS